MKIQEEFFFFDGLTQYFYFALECRNFILNYVLSNKVKDVEWCRWHSLVLWNFFDRLFWSVTPATRKKWLKNSLCSMVILLGSQIETINPSRQVLFEEIFSNQESYFLAPNSFYDILFSFVCVVMALVSSITESTRGK